MLPFALTLALTLAAEPPALPDGLEGWLLDGEATVELDAGEIRLTPTAAAVLWAPVEVESPAEVAFEARTADEGTRAILFFMAQAVDGRPLEAWRREAEYGEYAYDETMELYSVGLLRGATGTDMNLRRLGGPLPERFHILRRKPAELDEAERATFREAFASFQPYSIRAAAETDHTALDTWHRYRVRVDGGRIDVFVDGERVLHHEEAERPLLRGRLGFRNFRRDTTLAIRDLSVAPLGETGEGQPAGRD